MVQKTINNIEISIAIEVFLFKNANTNGILINNKIDIIIGTYCDSITALKRDYFANLSLDERHFLNKTNVDEYNKSFKRMKKLNKNVCFIDTNCDIKDVSVKACDNILNKMRSKYLEKINKM